MKNNMIKVVDNSKVGFHYVSPNGSIIVTKNKFGSWVVSKNGVEIESFGIGFNALVFATELQKVGA
jgi:hypothetical protein